MNQSFVKSKVTNPNTARRFSKESVVELTDKNLNVDASQLSFYLDHYNDAQIQAVNNKLVLQNQSYYSYSLNGSSYVWSVNNGKVQWPYSKNMMSEPTNGIPGKNYKWEMRNTFYVISALAQGKSLYGNSNKDVKTALVNIGITEGKFTIDAGAGEHNYILRSNREIIDLDNRTGWFDSQNWIERGYNERDTINVYEHDYQIDENGSINMSADDGFITDIITYPEKSCNK